MLRFLFLALLLLLKLPLSAQQADTSLFIRHFTPAEGFPADKIYVYPPVQDKNGYLWVPTEKKLLKYNGYSCKVFTTAQGLPSNEVVGTYYDRDGRLWLFTQTAELGYVQHDAYHSVALPEQVLPHTAGTVMENDRYIYFVTEIIGVTSKAVFIDKTAPDRPVAVTLLGSQSHYAYIGVNHSFLIYWDGRKVYAQLTSPHKTGLK